ncbi:MAG: hypothetical protein LUD72_05215 [Bacteroidales bacterium]|nr:hypothetical protein [Bacteroidales bacterium]
MKSDASEYKTAEVSVEDFFKQILIWDFGPEKNPYQRMCDKLDEHVEMFERNLPRYGKKITEMMRFWPIKDEEVWRYGYGWKKPAEAFLDILMWRKTDLILSEEYFREYIKLRHEAIKKGVALDTDRLYIALFDDEVEACFDYITRASPGDEARCAFPRRRVFTGEKYETYLTEKCEKIVKFTVPEEEGDEGGSVLWNELTFWTKDSRPSST